MFAHAQNSKSIQTLDSIYYYRSQANNSDLDPSQRFQFANKAIQLSKKTNQDSTILKSKVVLNNIYILKGDYETLITTNLQNIQLAESLKDSLLIAFANNNLGWAYKSLSKNDSAYYYYYKASKLFSKLQRDRNEGEVLFSLANIQFEEKDYLGAEENAITALRLIRNLPKTENNLDTLWSINNLLAIISDELGQFDKAIEYHHKALSFSDQIEDNYLYTLYSYSNIALIHKEQKQYEKALDIYKNLFKNKEILLQEPYNYAIILGDYAYVKHLSENFKTDEITSMFTEAYKISDSLQDIYSLMSISLNASEFYKDINQKDSALFFANRAYHLARETNTNDVILRSLILKSDIEEPDKAKSYLTEYVKLSDSLQNKERAIRNKFARIEFETDLIVERSKQIAKERLWLLFLSIGLIFTLLLLYIIVTQRTKNKELRFNQQQQETNEEIYNLMLSQQDKIDEARVAEKKRISEEIHDGILGRLFGIRLSLDSLNMSTQPEAIETREKYLEDLKEIEQDIRKVSHELNSDFVSGSNYISIIKSLLEKQTKAYKLKYVLRNDDNIDWDSINNKTKIHYYRIIQESLQNIYKHANATEVHISFKQKNNVICLSISDNGSGFDVNKARKGIGLKNINSRVKEIQGELDIISTMDSGTEIRIKTPI